MNFGIALCITFSFVGLIALGFIVLAAFALHWALGILAVIGWVFLVTVYSWWFNNL